METVNVLKNLMRKMRVGLVSAEDVRQGFDQVLEKSMAFSMEMELYKVEFRQYYWETYIYYENAIIEAKKAAEQSKRQGFETAMVWISKAKTLRKKINKQIEALQLLQQAREQFKRLEMDLNSLWLQQMPSVVLLKKSIEDADTLLREDKLLEANAIIRSCITDIQVFDQPGALAQEQAVQTDRLETLKVVCNNTIRWAQFCPVQPQLEVEGKISILLEELLQAGQIKLARRLIDDLEFYLKGRILFQQLLQDGSLDWEALSEKVATAMRQEGWEGGINCLLLHQTLQFRQSLLVETT
ncbi:MAG: hypothetical protein ACK4TA_08695 [Saprospiraceae bacterium]